LIGFNLSNKTVGVVGTGRIGVALCRILIGFGCKVIAYDLYPSDALIRMGIEYVDLDELFRQAEVISLHCPLTTETKHMINEKTLDVMKDGVMIINTSRGELIKTSDVIQGLIDRKVGYLGIDVYEQEEDLFFKDLSEHIIEDEFILRLNSFPNVLITSHQAYFTNDAMIEIASTTLDNIRDFKEGNALLNEVK
jgi:D-lactate dehydrogenase